MTTLFSPLPHSPSKPAKTMATPATTLLATQTSDAPVETCTTAVPGKHGAVPPTACNSNYLFEPSFSTNLVFCILFSVALIIHVFQMVHFRKV